MWFPAHSRRILYNCSSEICFPDNRFGARSANQNKRWLRQKQKVTEGRRVVVELAQGTDGMLMLSKLNKAQTARAGKPISWVHPLRVPQNLGLLHIRLSLRCVLFHLYNTPHFAESASRLR